MIDKLNKRREDGEEGFTLIELMVVVLIIGILLAIAVPTFLSAQKNAKNKAATSNARQALSAAKTVYTEKQTYVITLAELQAAEPGLNWLAETTASTGPQEISWDSVSASAFGIAVMSKNDICFSLFDSTATGTTYKKATVASGSTCAAPSTAPAAGVGVGNTPDVWN